MAYNKETGMWEGFIYKIWNDVNDKIYIGQTITNISTRFSEHKHCAKNNKYNNYVYNAMRKIGIDHFYISQVEKIMSDSKQDLISKVDQAERDHIQRNKDCGVELYNMTDGGDHIDAGYFNKPVIQYNAKGEVMNEFNSVKEASESIGVTYSVISSACNKHVFYSGGYIWRYKDDNLTQDDMNYLKTKKPNMGRPKKVYQFDFNGNFIKEYSSVTEAANLLSMSIGDISSCCRMEHKSAGGYIWLYNKDDINNYPYFNDLILSNHNQHNSLTLMKPVEQRDQYTGELIDTFNSQKEAADSLGNKSPSLISQCCLNHIATAYGFHWCYVGCFDRKNLLKCKHKQIDMFDKDGSYIQTFDSIRECVKYLGVQIGAGSDINNVCKGIRKSAYGYVWKYKNQ